MLQEVRNELRNESEQSIAELTAKLNPSSEEGTMIGVRIPKLRRIAKRIAKEDWKQYFKEINKEEKVYFEEKLLQGLVIGYIKVDTKERLKLIKSFIPKIDDWGICDSFCPTIPVKEEELDVYWEFILPYLKSKKEFDIRFAVIMMLDNFIIDSYVDKVIKELDKVNTYNQYYAQMAIAWTMAEVGIKYNKKAIKYLKGNNNLDKFTYNKTLQKMRESFRVSDIQKEELKKMKRS